MIRYIISVFVYLLSVTILISQNPFPDNGSLYQDDIVPRIDIILPADSLAKILSPEFLSSYYHYHADFIIDNGNQRDTIDNIGFRLRGNTSRHSDKKSFKVSFNTYETGRKYQGVEKLNLNGEHNDPSIVRSKLCADLAKEMEIPASRANHVKLYINGNYFGLYINVEHIDEEYIKTRYGNNNGNLYKCLYPADLNYLGSNPEAYKLIKNGRLVYDLKTNVEENDYTDIAHFISILNLTSDEDFRCELDEIFNVNAYIKIIVFDILTANWDGHIYNKNNFYLYHNTSTDKFEYILYDLDNTFGIDWFGVDWGKRNIYSWSPSSSNRPLYERIMADPVYWSLFTNTMKKTIDSIYLPSKLSTYLASKKELITPAAIIDNYRTLDYGFSFSDFSNSYTQAIDYNHVPIGISAFINQRYIWANYQLELDFIIPEIESSNIIINENMDAIQFLVKIQNKQYLSDLKIWYRFEPNDNFTSIILNDQGLIGDSSANDNIYSSRFINTEQHQSISYYFAIQDKNGFVNKYPACNTYVLHLPTDGQITLSINEFMASNDTIIADENGEYDDWIEIYNFGTNSIFLGDKFITDDAEAPSKWKMPNQWIASNEYMLFWADKDEQQGDNHCNFKLSASGEYIGIYNAKITDYKLIDSYTFEEQETDISTGRIPDGTGTFQIVFPTPGYTNQLSQVQTKINNDKFKIFPNPCYEYLEFDTNYQQNKNGHIEIFDIRGKFVKSVSNLSMSSKIDISALINGVYILNYTRNNKIYTSKFIKMNP